MKTTLDNALSNKIKNSFDSHKFEYRDEFWQNFRAKNLSPTKAKSINLLPILAKAAIITLFFSLLPKQTLIEQFSSFTTLPTIQTEKTKEIALAQKPQIPHQKSWKKVRNILPTPEPNQNNANNIQFLASKQSNLRTNFKNEIKLNSSTKNTEQYIAYTNESLRYPDLKKINTEKSNTKRFRLGLNLSGGSAKEKNSSGQNFEMGFLAGVRLTKKFSLHTGLSINKLNTDHSQSYLMETDKLNKVQISEVKNINYLTVPVGMAINLNKKFSLGVETSLAYVQSIKEQKQAGIAGISSSSNTFSSANSGQNYDVANTMQNNNNINQIEALGNVKISASYFFQLSNTQMQVEPFVQLPMNLTKSNLPNFTYMGLNLKYSLNLG